VTADRPSLPSPNYTFSLTSALCSRTPSLVYSLTSPFPALPSSSPIVDRWTIDLGDVDAGGGGPIWPLSGGTDPPYTFVFVTSLVLLAAALLLSFVIPIDMPSSAPAKPTPKTAETPAEELPFPGKLVEGKYDVQYLHL
jgi:hypothetical protein